MKKRLSFIFAMIFVFVGLFSLGFKVQTNAAQVTDEQLQAEIDNIYVPDRVIFDFPVVSKSMYGSTIEWTSSDAAVLEVPTNGGWVTVVRPASEDATVTLTVTLTNEGLEPKSKSFTVVVPAGVTLTNTYAINYVLNGGENSSANPTTYKVGQTPALNNPTKGVLEFLGWFDNEACEGTPLTELPKGISGDVTLYAKWADPVVTGIVVKTNPTKVTYNALETFDKTGIVVEKVFNYGENETVLVEELSFDKTTLHVVDTKVTVTYGSFSAEIDVTVNPINYDYTVEFEDALVTYNGQPQTLEYLFEETTGGLTVTLSEVVAKDVKDGGYKFTLTFVNSDQDYVTPDPLEKTLTIQKAPLVITADNKGVQVGKDLPAFTASYNGFVAGEDESVLTGALQFACDAHKGSPKGQYAIKVSGVTSNNYEIQFVDGTLTITEGNYQIVATDLNKTYNGTKQMFTAQLTEDGTEISGVTFTYTLDGQPFEGATNAGTYTVVASYNDATYGTGSHEFTFVINKATYVMTGVTFASASKVFTGEAQSLEISGALPEGVTVTYSEGLTNVGTKEITATFTGDTTNYEEVAPMKATLTITAKELEAAMFDSISEQAYTGSAIEPEVAGKFGSYVLTKGTDFTVVYANNTEKGTATITVSGQGNMSGSVTLTFEIGASALEKAQAGREEIKVKYSSILTGVVTSETISVDLLTTNGCTVQWTSKYDQLGLNNPGVVTITPSELESEVQLVATVIYGDAAEQTTFTFTIPAKEVVPTKTIQEMIDAPVDNTAFFQVTGIVSNIKNTTYGNFDLVDPNDPNVTIYVYGLLTEKGGASQQFSTLGIVEGDLLTLVGTRGEYNGTIQIADAYHVSHSKREVTITPEFETTQGNVTVSQNIVENGTEITITVEPVEGYKVSSVKAIANGKETTITAVDGVYKYVVGFNTTIAVEFVEEGAAVVESWGLVTDASDLKANDEIIIVAATADVALSTTQNGNNRGQAAITKEGNVINTLPTDVQKIKLEAGTKEGTFALYASNGTDTGYLYAASSSSNYLRTQTLNNDNGSWMITIDANGNASIVAQGNNTRNLLKYNSSSKIFSCYGSGQKDVQIYVKTIS